MQVNLVPQEKSLKETQKRNIVRRVCEESKIDEKWTGESFDTIETSILPPILHQTYKFLASSVRWNWEFCWFELRHVFFLSVRVWCNLSAHKLPPPAKDYCPCFSTIFAGGLVYNFLTLINWNKAFVGQTEKVVNLWLQKILLKLQIPIIHHWKPKQLSCKTVKIKRNNQRR